MRGVWRILLMSMGFLLMAGCAAHRPPAPLNVNGRYYMAGDPECVQFRKAGSKILCMDAKGRVTGKRRAMTDQELLMYTHNQQMRQMQSIEMELMMSRGPWWGPWGW